MTDPDDFHEQLMLSRIHLGELLEGLPSKWVAFAANRCVKGIEFQGNGKKATIAAISRWHLVGVLGFSIAVDGQTAEDRWDIIRDHIATAQRGYAEWLKKQSDKFHKRANHIRVALREEKP